MHLLESSEPEPIARDIQRRPEFTASLLDNVGSMGHRYASESTVSYRALPITRRCNSMNASIELVSHIGRRPRAPSGGQFTLKNLASSTSQDDISRSLKDRNISPEASVQLLGIYKPGWVHKS